MPPTVGIVSIQGDFEKHIQMIQRIEPSAEIRSVKTAEDLAGVDRVIIPGGESTTVGKLMVRFGLADALITAGQRGMPIWGTCMGMILLAREVEGSDQFTLGLLDITVRRNAFGRQVHSFEDSVEIAGLEEAVTGVYIRAPIVTRWGAEVQPLARYEDQVVAVRQGNLLGTAFHPELTDDPRLHAWFMSF